jgi:acylphosphatase
MKAARLYRLEGRVQGVWFRESTRREADRLGIRGYANNLPDGSVEVLACGLVEALHELESWLRQGPPMARVSKLEARAFTGDWPEQFSTGWSRPAE